MFSLFVILCSLSLSLCKYARVCICIEWSSLDDGWCMGMRVCFHFFVLFLVSVCVCVHLYLSQRVSNTVTYRNHTSFFDLPNHQSLHEARASVLPASPIFSVENPEFWLFDAIIICFTDFHTMKPASERASEWASKRKMHHEVWHAQLKMYSKCSNFYTVILGVLCWVSVISGATNAHRHTLTYTNSVTHSFSTPIRTHSQTIGIEILSNQEKTMKVLSLCESSKKKKKHTKRRRRRRTNTFAYAAQAHSLAQQTT